MKSMSRFSLALMAGTMFGTAALAQEPPIRIALMTDMAGPSADYGGKGGMEAVKMAVEEVGGSINGRPVEIAFIDHQNKPDVAVTKAREAYDNGTDMIINLSNSAAALGVMEIAKAKDKVAIVTGAGSSKITGDACSPNTVHFAFNAYSLSNAPVEALTKDGDNEWFLIVSDFAYGLSVESAVTGAVGAAGGKIAGSVKHPAFMASDFSSYALQAISSGAKVIGLANSSSDTTNSIRALKEFGLGDDQKMLAFTLLINEVHGLGLDQASGLVYATAFSWDRTDASREWSKRFFDRVGKMPNMVNAGDYSGTLHYLRAVEAAGSTDSAKVLAKMHEMPVNDMFAENGRIREDGMMVHDMYLVQVKKPEDSKYPWDYETVLKTIPADQAFIPLEKSECPLVKKG
ncbi:MAG: ABC transporter substrate-binding protein [Alphaproteobacteria bacterium]|nr:ABC transporter substrate-binding protein [Rhizobiaceae bacterium]MBU3962182.1 ABC transporter substrate-binding protein [Alphaproteobacteria bacterium]MBU4089864.1 ABC transporter substrate-binding protein [Alphaproteobacteria bacterium]